MKKINVLDTNVLLNDPNAIYNFHPDDDVIVPITVINELDKFKQGTELINRNARQVTRNLENIFRPDGAWLHQDKKGKGRIFIDTNQYKASTPDETILQSLRRYKTKNNEVVLISKDINLRLRAKAYRYDTQDYEVDKSQIDPPYKGYREIHDIDLASPGGLDLSQVYTQIKTPVNNEYILVKNGKQSILLKTDKTNSTYTHVKSNLHAAGIAPRNLEQCMAMDALLDPKIQLVTLTGTSGSGKTLLSLAAAISQKRNYLQIYLSKPTVPVEHDLGFLPGTIEEKMQPYMESYHDNLAVIKESFKKDKVIQSMLEEQKIQIAPISYIRGRSLPQIFYIIDECQNLTHHGVKSIITRAGEGTKIVMIGDTHQIDSPYLSSKSNGLTYLINKMRDQSVYAHVTLKKGERSTLAELASNIL